MAQRVTTHNPMFPAESVAMDPNVYDMAVQTAGIRFRHYRAMRCPFGMSDPNDIRRTHDHHGECSNGYIYKYAGSCMALYTGNSTDFKFQDVALVDGSSVRVTFSRYYDDRPDERVHVSFADRMYPDGADVQVPSWNTLKAHETGRERLQFEATKIGHVIDSGGREYDPSLYRIDNGDLLWLTPDRPLPGTVLTVWHLYQAFYYVERLINQVRIVQIVDPHEGPKMERMQESAILTRENVFRNETNDPNATDTPRKQDAPESGGFGGR